MKEPTNLQAKQRRKKLTARENFEAFGVDFEAPGLYYRAPGHKFPVNNLDGIRYKVELCAQGKRHWRPAFQAVELLLEYIDKLEGQLAAKSEKVG